ncbi:MAG TPA: hypothetical protein VL096_21485 [Pirellulaceae bacterium]|nr:hypothetical protein [Pirellulaceae bacterium]
MIQRPHKNIQARANSRNPMALSSQHLRQQMLPGKRARGGDVVRDRSFVPPEQWHEPSEEPTGCYRLIAQLAGEGYRHAVTPDEVRDRLAQLPSDMLQCLEVVQLSRITKKKLTFPCYGMQWGNAVYLYPIEESLVEYYPRPPRPMLRKEAEMYGGKWVQEAGGAWKLVWTEASIKDFYLNNILIHELGHLLDQRNTSYIDRERFAEWFAIEYGYKPSQRTRLAATAASRMVVKRHAKK